MYYVSQNRPLDRVKKGPHAYPTLAGPHSYASYSLIHHTQDGGASDPQKGATYPTGYNRLQQLCRPIVPTEIYRLYNA